MCVGGTTSGNKNEIRKKYIYYIVEVNVHYVEIFQIKYHVKVNMRKLQVHFWDI